MNKKLLLILILLKFFANAQTDSQIKVLFVYDNQNERNEMIITGIKEELNKNEIEIIQRDLKESKKGKNDITTFSYILIYSEVRAFKMRIFLRRWLRKIDSFNGKKVGIFVSAITWKYSKKITEKIKATITEKEGQFLDIDAITMATNNMTEHDKKKRAKRFAKSFVNSLKN